MTLPGASSIPAVVADHPRLATATGRRICDMVWEDLKPSDILSAESFDNAIIADMAIGGSTNAIVHLIAMAGRAGLPLDLDRFDELSRSTPVIGNIRPAGQYLMEDLYNAGGLRALLWQLRELLNLDCMTVTGRTLGENISKRAVYDENVILPLNKPLSESGGTFVLRGNLAPDGCVIKPVAADPTLRRHTGPAVVFEDYNDMDARLNDPDLDVTADSVLVLQKRRSAGRTWISGMGHAAHPQQTAATRRARHGAHLRCENERHQLRHVRAARVARVSRRRHTGPGPDR